MDEEYLGDGLYVSFIDGKLVLVLKTYGEFSSIGISAEQFGDLYEYAAEQFGWKEDLSFLDLED